MVQYLQVQNPMFRTRPFPEQAGRNPRLFRNRIRTRPCLDGRRNGALRQRGTPGLARGRSPGGNGIQAGLTMEAMAVADIPLPAGTEPIRGEIYSADHLMEYASALAARHKVGSARRRGFHLLRRVEENGAALHGAHRAIARTLLAD